MLRRLKVSVIGAGNVGATTAQRLAELGLGDVVLVDIIPDMPQGKALDLQEAGPVRGYDGRVVGANGYEESSGSDVVVITSGVPRKPGMSRDDLLQTNAKIIKDVTQSVVRHSPEAVLVMVANPLDAMTFLAHRVSGFPRERVVGMAGALDAARFRAFLALELNVSVENIHATVLGGHGDTMVPSTRYTTVAGVPIEQLLSKDRLAALVERTRKGGEEIVKLLKTGSAFYAPSAAAVEMVESIARDRRKIIPSCVLCKGEYGVNDTFLGVPAVLGKKGLERVFEVPLSAEESAALKKSASAVRELCDAVVKMGF